MRSSTDATWRDAARDTGHLISHDSAGMVLLSAACQLILLVITVAGLAAADWLMPVLIAVLRRWFPLLCVHRLPRPTPKPARRTSSTALLSHSVLELAAPSRRRGPPVAVSPVAA